MSAKTTQIGVVATGAGDDIAANVAVVQVPAPTGTPAPGYVRVAVDAAAVNPVDWKMVQYNFLLSKLPAQVLGNDASGKVTAVGEGVTNVKVGDEVYAYTPIADANGAFQEAVDTPWYTVFPKPEALSHADAATVPLAIFTAAVALFKQLPSLGADLALAPGSGAGRPLLIWGGASSVGHVAIQLANYAGFRVITLASAKHTERLTALGAAAVIDYHDADYADQVAAALNGEPLTLAFDTISPDTTLKAAALLDSSQPSYITSINQGIEDATFPDNVTHIFTIVVEFNPESELGQWAAGAYDTIASALQAIPIQAQNVLELGSSWADLANGIAQLAGGVSGVKLVATHLSA
ncbi:zinc-binding oxidoreductase CipB [Thecamonas trahens ATCC 50062]|uniref:Zinc-binding oxidoreductase CipB n=1 Tax=Thecamonas trahens ATCC 50062 TaxID=461836 RepID=A0A0L0DLA3_THETB|nr:zinc-binding oxidoreductase CipB [Thecamonas trahens ATCC 50062]KNC52168.1 zinc-binding oxidoreductase CipB [Thecamonas trahens ATCC 50062]|eukprot:XP_013762171.1 zinc-binding oxidoreductase CipB [Thecamonas trahens ATCC 50062]